MSKETFFTPDFDPYDTLQELMRIAHATKMALSELNENDANLYNNISLVLDRLKKVGEENATLALALKQQQSDINLLREQVRGQNIIIAKMRNIDIEE